MSDPDAPEIPPLDRLAGVPRLVLRPLFAGVELRAYGSPRPDAVPDAVLLLSREQWEALVRLFARRYPARFHALAGQELGTAGRAGLGLEAPEGPGP